MSEIEIALARAYLSASDQDPVAALIRSVRDLARTRRLLASRTDLVGRSRASSRRDETVIDVGSRT